MNVRSVPEGFESPKLVGNDDFVATVKTIPELLGSSSIITFNLSFIKVRNKLPEFGLSTVTAKQLFDLSVQKQCHVGELGVVRRHTWVDADKDIWPNRTCDNNCAVAITFRHNSDKPNVIEIIFYHDSMCSLVYSYRMSKVQNEVYFLIFIPQREVDLKRIALLSNFDYLTMQCEGVKAKRSDKRFVPNACVSCYDNLADIVFRPCGHSALCQKCDDRHNLTPGGANCPICKQHVSDRVVRELSAKFCLTCPPIVDCKEVNAMLLPCRCVVGCMNTTTLSILPGEECISCDKKVEEIQQIYFG